MIEIRRLDNQICDIQDMREVPVMKYLFRGNDVEGLGLMRRRCDLEFGVGEVADLGVSCG
jgi:hypothetical protein